MVDEFHSQSVLPTEIARRQEFARELNGKISELVENNRKLREILALMIWHGSLPRGKGGEKYDIDYAIFLRADTPSDLIDKAGLFTAQVFDCLQGISWLRDLHYDGMNMFEAHTHYNIRRSVLDTHIGIHFYREIALQELFGEFDWRTDKRPNSNFFRLFESWRRYCFFYRHWIYEGHPVYDPDEIFSKARNLDCLPPTWLRRDLRDVVVAISDGYAKSPDGICSVHDSKQLALDMVAATAYILEQRPIGRSIRYKYDINEFNDDLAKSLLRAVVDDNLKAVADLMESLVERRDV